MVKKIDKKPQDKTSIESRILTKLEELAYEFERKKKKENKEYGMTPRHLADELEIHPDTLMDKISTFMILQDLGIKIRLIEDGKGRTIIITEPDNINTLKEISEKLDKIINSNIK